MRALLLAAAVAALSASCALHNHRLGPWQDSDDVYLHIDGDSVAGEDKGSRDVMFRTDVDGATMVCFLIESANPDEPDDEPCVTVGELRAFAVRAFLVRP